MITDIPTSLIFLAAQFQMCKKHPTEIAIFDLAESRRQESTFIGKWENDLRFEVDAYLTEHLPYWRIP